MQRLKAAVSPKLNMKLKVPFSPLCLCNGKRLRAGEPLLPSPAHMWNIGCHMVHFCLDWSKAATYGKLFPESMRGITYFLLNMKMFYIANKLNKREYFGKRIKLSLVIIHCLLNIQLKHYLIVNDFLWFKLFIISIF